MMSSARIYLSSTYEDLKDHRRVAFEMLRKAGYEVVAMEDYVARDKRPVDACLQDVARADVYVGLFGFRYGYVPPTEHHNPASLSITELEFREAERLRKPCLVFLVDDKLPWRRCFDDVCTGGDKGERINALRAYLSTEKMASIVSSAHDLAGQVVAAVTRTLQESRAKTAAATPVTWDIARQGSPFPGLMHFTRKYAPVFFGREAEVRGVLDLLDSPEGRFVIVSGDSGVGKSSLVEGGVLPRLETGGLSGAPSCRWVRMVPSQGRDPFDALLRVLHPYAQQAELDPYQLGEAVAAAPERLPAQLETIIARGLEGDTLVLFLDQMEELFTARVRESVQGETDAFLSGLYRAALACPLRVVATIRSDLLHHCYRHPDLLEVLRPRGGHYPLGRVEPEMMRDMIVKPARAAGLKLAESLANRLIQDTGAEPGNLPLLAFVLERLFEERRGAELSEAAYQAFGGPALGGLKGALADHTRATEQALAQQEGPAVLDRLPEVFSALLTVNAEGLPTRRRARRADFAPALRPIVELLVKARLLVAEGDAEGEGESTVSVAHEKLFEAWPALTQWIAEHQEELRTHSQAVLDAEQWHAHDYDLGYLWHAERLLRLQGIIERLPADRSPTPLREFAQPQAILVKRLNRVGLEIEERLAIGKYLSAMGDTRPGVGLDANGIPDIEWVAIPGARVVLEEGKCESTIGAFQIARYSITNGQFQSFIDALDGYSNPAWWEGITKQKLKTQGWAEESNTPRETVSWYEAVAFCRWLSARLGFEIRLPTEYEWQQAATGGDPERVYPWGMNWDAARCNSRESGIRRTTVVGLYPNGASPHGVLDMAGNVWEWCFNQHEYPDDDRVNVWWGPRSLRGGSWNDEGARCRVASRYFSSIEGDPDHRFDHYGFRLLRPPSSNH